MNRIILASHAGMSAGIKDTLQMVLGELPNLYVVATTRDESETIVTVTRRLLENFEPGDQVAILTDILGGSVNNDMMTLLTDYSDIRIICGMNLSLVLSLAMHTEPWTGEIIRDAIHQAKEQIIDCTEMIKGAAAEDGGDL
ncbi:MAG: PTS sugar transporter subunit IIA [Lacrimispora sphenoides]